MSEGGDGTGGAPHNTRGGQHRKRQARSARRRVFNSGFTTLRDFVTFILGTGIVIHEVLSTDVDLAAMGVGLSLMGLPFALAADEKRKGGDE